MLTQKWRVRLLALLDTQLRVGDQMKNNKSVPDVPEEHLT